MTPAQRLEIATRIAQGILAGRNSWPNTLEKAEELARSSFVITDLLIAQEHASRDAAGRLVAVARAAWRLVDNTEENDDGAMMDKEDLKVLSSALDDLDKLPEIPPPPGRTKFCAPCVIVAEGPAKAAFALGLEDPR